MSNSSDYFRNEERSSLIEQLKHPRQLCCEYKRCNSGEEIPPCEIRGRMYDEYVKWVENLINLSDIPRWYSLREALRTLWESGALKACTMQDIHRVAFRDVKDEASFQMASNYDNIRAASHAHVVTAKKEMSKLANALPAHSAIQPQRSVVKDFTSYKQALCEMVIAGLEALEEFYALEEAVISKRVLKVVNKASALQSKGGLIHIADKQNGEQYWDSVAILVEAGKAILREPDVQKAEVKEMTGHAFRQAIAKLTDAEVKILRAWFDNMEPGLYDRMENDPDQVQIIRDLEQKGPPFSPFCSYVLQLSLKFKEDDLAPKLPRSKWSKKVD